MDLSNSSISSVTLRIPDNHSAMESRKLYRSSTKLHRATFPSSLLNVCHRVQPSLVTPLDTRSASSFQSQIVLRAPTPCCACACCFLCQSPRRHPMTKPTASGRYSRTLSYLIPDVGDWESANSYESFNLAILAKRIATVYCLATE